MTARASLVLAFAACATPDGPAPVIPATPAPNYDDAGVELHDAATMTVIDDALEMPVVDADAATVPDPTPVVALPMPAANPNAGPELWLKGSTHVHAEPSGDSTEPIPDVIAWYESRDYDFIVLTDHNRVSELEPQASTRGEIVLRPADQGRLLVIAGIELTHNPSNCIPRGDDQGRCRIHVNLLGPTERPIGKLTWANRKTDDRLLKYDAALVQQKALGGIAQVNHPNWFWGMTPDVLVALARGGYPLVEIANSAFTTWNDGDKDHPGIEAIWDEALSQGATIWGVGSDDAHHYRGKGRYPAGGAWVVVKAARDPVAILAALAAGRFYASTGVVLERAEIENDELVVEVAPKHKGSYTIEFISGGKRVARVKGKTARHAIPETGYVRALVTRGDGARAWVQPARR